MVKILFLCVFLVNIVFFLWEYRKGAPEIYLPPSYENSIGLASYAEKIILLSETPEVKMRAGEANSREMRAQQSEAQSVTEIDSEILLIESEQKVIAKDEAVEMPDSKILAGSNLNETLTKDIKLTEEESSQSNFDMRPISVQNVFESVVKKNPAEQINSDSTQTKEKSELDSLIETNSVGVSDEQGDIESSNTSQGLNLPIVACYRLKTGEYTQNTFAQETEESDFTLELFEQQIRDINSYLVLTSVALSYQEAVNREQDIKQQGIDDLWLFRQGQFKWRISLGLFSGIEQANKAIELFSKQTDKVLEVVPSYLTTNITVVKISAQEEQKINTFEQKYSMIVDQKIECSKE